MTNILDVRDTSEIGGPGKTIIETALKLNNKKYKNYIAVFQTRKEKQDSPFIKELKKQNVPCIVLKSFNQYDPFVIFKLIKIIKKYNISVVHTHEPKSDIIGYIASLFCDVKLISTVHGWISNSKRDTFYNKLDILLLKKFDKVIVVSNLMKSQLGKEGIQVKKLELLYNSIVIENYRKFKSSNIIEKILNKKLAEPVIATIGRLNPEKGHKDFIDAINVVIKKGFSASFVLIGDGIEKNALQKSVKKYSLESHVFFTGYIQDIAKVYNEIDLLVLPSYTEGLPNVVLESLLMEVPVIATAVGGTPEILTHNQSGVLVEPGNFNELADSLINFLQNREKFSEMSKKGRGNITSKFNFARRTELYESLIDNMFNYKGN